MGQRLHPLKKEYLFTNQWRDTLEYIQFDEDSSVWGFSFALCQRMATLRLRDIHDKVHKERWTCVHGDYHIANWLFPRRNGQKPVLIDWATCGYGNPMVDVVFFLVVSTNDQVVSNIDTWLEGYYRSLTRHNPALSSKITFMTIREWFQWALLCQWMILVAYDEMCRQIVATEPNVSKKNSQRRHFENVNRRAVLAMNSIGNWDIILSRVPNVTDEERREAEDYSKHTPLAI
jgi:thiamine kinase-like enzyme